jgi:hypothetical protein
MASIINASTSGVGGVITTADNSGDLNIQSGGTTIVAITSSGAAITGAVTSSALTSGRITYATTGGELIDSANLLFDGSNVGIGVTPSAWGSTWKAIQIGTSGAVSFVGGANLLLSNNTYSDGTNDIYLQTTSAAKYIIATGGIHRWSNAPSGTAGTAATFTERMTLDASGNLGIGTTSPVGTLDVASLTPNVTIRNTKSGLWTDGEVVGTLSWYTDDTSGINAHDVASIEAINTGSQTTPNSNLVFSTAVQNVPKVERMRITSTGHLELTTGHYYGLFTGTDFGIELRPTLGTSGAVFASFLNNTGTRIGSISRNTTTNAVLYNTTSDERLKENIADSNPVLETISKIKVRQYDWKDANVHQDYGFIAQELDTVIDGVVTKPDDEELMWSVDYSKITPHLVKAIQEQQAMIKELKAEIDLLKGVK